MGRSGSTLLRFLLDAHPDLACPPETNMSALCGQLAEMWSLIEGAPLAPGPVTAPPRVPEAAVGGIRRMLDEMTGSYLERRGKRLFCEKSLGSARFADLVSQIYPDTRFLCLYRHPMDMIQSGLDACPWGLNGYGFDQYIAGSPGNAVMALARYWLDNAALINEVEKSKSERCHRIRYEDLVEDPEDVMREVYAFLGVRPAPGVAQACFSGDRERHGPGDHKIWATSKVSADSVGKGESVPAGLIAPPVTEAINELVAALGYLPVDDEWGTPGRVADPRAPDTVRGRATSSGRSAPGAALLEERLRSRLEDTGGRPVPQAAEKFLLVSRTATGGGETQWLVDSAARTITVEDTADDTEADGEGTDDVTWSIMGSPQTWEAVLTGQRNLHAALRHNELRYCPIGTDGTVVNHGRIAVLADLLGLNTWARATAWPDDTARQDTVAVA